MLTLMHSRGGETTSSLPDAATIRRALATTHREAIFLSLMLGLTEPFMIPYALALGASTFDTGVLNAARQFVPALAQLKAGDAVAWWGSRKWFIFWSAGAQALLWIPLAVVGPLCGLWAVPALIILYTVGAAGCAIGGPAWASMVSQYLAPHERGRFFGHRALLVGAWMTLAGLAAGALLQTVSTHPLAGFALLCAGATLSRAGSCYWISRFHETPLEGPAEPRLSFRTFLRQAATHPVARLGCCMAAASFAIYLAFPFYAVYMLKELGYDYATYTIISLLGSGMTMLAMPWWGRVADRHGNRAVLCGTLAGSSVVPLGWMLARHPAAVGALHAVGGWLSAGWMLCAISYVCDASTLRERTRVVGYFNVLNGLGMGLGALLGGWLVDHAPLTAPFSSVFGLSAGLQLIAACVFARAIHEVRPRRDDAQTASAMLPVGFGR